jgi:hypothetical protein
MSAKHLWIGTATLALAAAMTACGGSESGGGPSNSGGGGTGGGGGGGTGTIAATITIGANGAVSPRDVTVPVGSRVTFVNNHNAPHDMASDPHPEHSNCPDLNLVGFLSPNQSRTSGNLNTPRTCGFHDHINDTNPALQGVIRVQ